jgi:hypothetical protein
MEYGDLQPFGRDGGQTTVGVPRIRNASGCTWRSTASERAITRPMVSAAVWPAASRKKSGLRISRSSKKI